MPDSTETAKEKMREALERKKNREHLANEARRNTGAVHGSQVNGGGKRTFRRKSG
ncbi:DUF5302 domain-containing protein [uncultured Georgenia sp.]|uniref:DUF5302 domain-containing protein n=1 Tax=uncultured Georgenia sp. TaxID=378209 RepID=UPI002624F525|nr:DUF5302 domain-containing protein [uncultured Georgenia sp.]HLV03906.1 DUF5302 domain-containing protein [Actinomycetaceae bacterium]